MARASGLGKLVDALAKAAKEAPGEYQALQKRVATRYFVHLDQHAPPDEEGRLRKSFHRVPYEGEQEWIEEYGPTYVEVGTSVYYAPMVNDGQMHRVTGLEALKVWMYKALLTARGRFAAYSATFGSDLEALVGSEYSPAAARSEAQRMVTEALLVSPYISAVSSVEVALEGSLLAVKCAVATVYGSASLEVTV